MLSASLNKTFLSLSLIGFIICPNIYFKCVRQQIVDLLLTAAYLILKNISNKIVAVVVLFIYVLS